jgi:tetratricopeptide (TPR) repeat protein
MKDIFDIQDEIARSIAERLKITLDGARQERLGRAGTENLEAYQLYLKGRALLYRRGSAIQRALECFQQAVALDPEYPLAWAGLADAYFCWGGYGFGRGETGMPKAMDAVQRALALDHIASRSAQRPGDR